LLTFIGALEQVSLVLWKFSPFGVEPALFWSLPMILVIFNSAGIVAVCSVGNCWSSLQVNIKYCIHVCQFHCNLFYFLKYSKSNWFGVM
jgi:hypothetical protein